MKKKRILQHVQSRIADDWPTVLLVLLGLGLVIAVLWFRLGSLVPGLTISEASYLETVTTDSVRLRDVLSREAIFLPFTFGLYALQAFGESSITALRSIGAIFGFFSVVSFFLIIQKWHTTRIALLMTLMYLTSAGFLHFARLADPAAAYLLFVPLIACAVFFRENKRTTPTVIALLIIVLTSLFLPGLIWLLLVGMFWQRRALAKLVKNLSRPTILGITLSSIIAIGLLGLSLYNDPSNVHRWLGLPEQLPSLTEFLRNLINIPQLLFWQGPKDPAVWVGISGMIDVFVSVLFLLGCYAYYFQRKLDRTKVLFGSTLILSILVALNGPVPIFILVACVYLVAAAGMSLLLQQWFTVFPRNPFARSAALILIVACVSFATFYNTQRYFVAWPKTPATRAVFQQQPE